MPEAAINGTTIHYDVHGSGFPLVFVHGGFGGLGTGAGAQAPDWLDRFAADFTVILYDRRSSGRSGFEEIEHTMALFADDIHALLAELGFERAHVWGTSAGGQITLGYGLDHPAAATGLVVADSAPWLSRDEDLRAKLRERIDLLQREGAEAAYAARRENGTVGLNLFAAARPAQSEAEQEAREAQRARIQAQLAKIPREERIAKYAGELRTYEAYLGFDASTRLGELSPPTLVVYGTADTVFPDAGWAEAAARNPKISYRAVEGAEHGLTAAHPGTLGEIHAFLSANTP
jgi:pimeloyl-ACP methyl ester carboxylesterase